MELIGTLTFNFFLFLKAISIIHDVFVSAAEREIHTGDGIHFNIITKVSFVWLLSENLILEAERTEIRGKGMWVMLKKWGGGGGGKNQALTPNALKIIKKKPLNFFGFKVAPKNPV